MFPHLQGLNLEEWIHANRENWGLRKNIWEDSEFWAFVTRGPNNRSEFHIDPGDEIFHQLQGELRLHYMKPDGRRALAVLKPGELLLLPATVPHSPRRGEGSWTLVVERRRRPDEMEQWVWYCEACDGKLYEVSKLAGDPSDVVAEGLAALREEEKLRTCARCGHTSTI